MQEIAKINKNKRYYEGSPELLASYVAMKPDLDAQKQKQKKISKINYKRR